jgi:SAM-dependent methyltransferase
MLKSLPEALPSWAVTGKLTNAPTIDPSEPFRRIYGAESVQQRRFLNVGAGSFRHPAWMNVDYMSEWYEGIPIDINWNLMSDSPLEVDDEWAKIVYTSHTLEHVPDFAAEQFFRESLRVLEPGGLLRITVPDAELAWRALLRNDRTYFLRSSRRTLDRTFRASGYRYPLYEASTPQLFLAQIATIVSDLHVETMCPKLSDDEVNELFVGRDLESALDACTALTSNDIQRRFPGNHVNWWTAAKLERKLREAGFKTVYRSGYGQSACPALRDLRYFDCKYPGMSLYVEAEAG